MIHKPNNNTNQQQQKTPVVMYGWVLQVKSAGAAPLGPVGRCLASPPRCDPNHPICVLCLVSGGRLERKEDIQLLASWLRGFLPLLFAVGWPFIGVPTRQRAWTLSHFRRGVSIEFGQSRTPRLLIAIESALDRPLLGLGPPCHPFQSLLVIMSSVAGGPCEIGELVRLPSFALTEARRHFGTVCVKPMPLPPAFKDRAPESGRVASIGWVDVVSLDRAIERCQYIYHLGSSRRLLLAASDAAAARS